MLSRTDNPQPDWQFPDLAAHNPDCSVVSDDSLKQAIFANWPVSNGVVTIPYTFSSSAYYFVDDFLLQISTYLHWGLKPLTMDSAHEKVYKASVEIGLDRWVQASNGTLAFNEVSFWEFLNKKRGITFNLGSNARLNAKGAGAVTMILQDNNRHIRQAAIYYPNAIDLWPTNDTGLAAWNANAITHEIGHALGFNHFHDYQSILQPLQQIHDGAYCSVMPYDSYFVNTDGECKSACNPAYAIFPAKLDSRIFSLASQENYPRCSVLFNKKSLLWVIHNGLAECVNSYSYSFLHSSVRAFTENLSVKPGTMLLSKTTASLIADSSFLAATLYMEGIPNWSSTVFLATAAAKYLPDSFLDHLSPTVKTIVTSNYSIYVLNGAIALSQGSCVIPMTVSMLSSQAGSFIGIVLGQAVGYLSAKFICVVPKAIYTACHENDSAERDPASLITITDPVDPPSDRPDESHYHSLRTDEPDVPVVSSNPNSFFNRVRNYFCSNAMSHEPDIENQIEMTLQ